MRQTFFKITAFTALIILVAPIWAQDIIVTNDAKKIDAKIIEVSTSQVRYKELENLDGPIYILQVDEINSIIYANGKVALYNQPKEVSENGNTWGLSGRSLVGSLPKPSNNFRQEGKVVIQIQVNASGKVVEAKVAGGDISDKQTQQLALDAALKARFTEGDQDQIGTITYIFKLN